MKEYILGNVFKKAVTLVSLMGALGSTSAIAAEYSGLVEIMPGSVLLSSGLEDFSASGTDSKGNFQSDDVKNGASYMPTISAGFEIDTDYWRYHLLAGIGMMKHDVFDATIIKYEIAMYYTGGLQTGFAIGPHIINYNIMNPTWTGNTSLTLSGTNAIAPGLAFTVGDKFVIKGSIDYLMGGTIDVAPDAGYTASGDLELDGVMVQLGVMIRF
jgi:hypothetical protein